MEFQFAVLILHALVECLRLENKRAPYQDGVKRMGEGIVPREGEGEDEEGEESVQISGASVVVEKETLYSQPSTSLLYVLRNYYKKNRGRSSRKTLGIVGCVEASDPNVCQSDIERP
jgi:hypothetical protein